jgi:hypothetical protein
MFEGLKIPVPEMEEMIKKHVQNKVEGFAEYWNRTSDNYNITQNEIETYLNQSK